jgi:hypothetical protein
MEVASGGPEDHSRQQRVNRRRTTRRRLLVERITPGLVVGVLAALVAFVLVAGVLRERRDMTTVAVAARTLASGEPVSEDAVVGVDVASSSGLGGSLLSPADLAGTDVIAQRLIAIGEPITRSAVGNASARPPARTIALPLDGWGQAGGTLSVGDAVDVIDTREATAQIVVRSAPVITHSSGGDGDGLLGSDGGVWVAIEVSEEQSLRVAEVVAADRFVLVRSTGVVP